MAFVWASNWHGRVSFNFRKITHELDTKKIAHVDLDLIVRASRLKVSKTLAYAVPIIFLFDIAGNDSYTQSVVIYMLASNVELLLRSYSHAAAAAADDAAGSVSLRFITRHNGDELTGSVSLRRIDCCINQSLSTV